MRRLVPIAVCLFLAGCVLFGAGTRFYLPVPLSLSAALAIAGAVGLAAGGAAPRAVADWTAGALLVAPVWAAFGFWAAAGPLGREALPFLAYPLAASAGVAAGLAAWRLPRAGAVRRLLPVAACAAAVFGMTFLPAAIRGWTAPAARPAPRFSLPLLGGGTLDSRTLAGKTAVFAFWASWCTPCRAELPRLQRVSRRYADDPSVRFYLVDVGLGGETPDKGRRFLRKHHIHLPSAFDRKGTVARRFDTRGMLPYRVLVGPRGRIRYRSFGYSSGDSGFRALRRAIAGASR